MEEVTAWFDLSMKVRCYDCLEWTDLEQDGDQRFFSLYKKWICDEEIDFNGWDFEFSCCNKKFTIKDIER